MSRAAVGGNHQAAPPDASLAGGEAERFLGQGFHPGPVGAADEFAGGCMFPGTAEDQDVVIQLVDDSLGQGGKMFQGPKLGRSKGPTPIENDYAAVVAQAQLSPETIGQLVFVLKVASSSRGDSAAPAASASRRQ